MTAASETSTTATTSTASAASTQVYPAEAADPYAISAEQAIAELAGAPWRRLAVLGDSLARGVGDPSPGYRDVSWADRLVEALRTHQPELEYLNTGKVGARAREVADEQLAAVLDFRPDLAIVVCGGNDLVAPDFSAEDLAGQLERLFRPLHEQGADIVTYTLQDISAAYPELASLRDGIALLNETVRRAAEAVGATVVEMWGHPAQAEKDRYSADLMHGSRRGHAAVAASTVLRLGERIRARA